MEGRPWSFDRQIIVINELDGNIPPSQMKFSTSPFWVQVHDMPLICMTKGVGEKIGESMGIFEDVDVAGDGAGWGRCLRIRVNIDIKKPLDRGRALNLCGKSSWVTFKYEKLPLFCFNCGCIVHDDQGCSVPRPTRLSSVEETKKWGVWLRTEDPRNRWNSGSKESPQAAGSTGEGRQDRSYGGDGATGTSSSYQRASHHGLQLPSAVGAEYRGFKIGSAVQLKEVENTISTAAHDEVATKPMQETSWHSTNVENIHNEKSGEHQGALMGPVHEMVAGTFPKTNPAPTKECNSCPARVRREAFQLSDECSDVGCAAFMGVFNEKADEEPKGGQNSRKWKRRARVGPMPRDNRVEGAVAGKKRTLPSADANDDGLVEGGNKGKRAKQDQGDNDNEMVEAVEQPRQDQ
jgi:hypothetical protein